MHTQRSPLRFLCLGKDSHTDLAPRRQLYLLPTCILHSFPRSMQTLPKQAHSSLLLSLICVCPQTTGIMEQKSHPAHQREGASVTRHQIWKTKMWPLIITFNKQTPAFSQKTPFFTPHFSSQCNDPVLWVCICLPGHSHLISFVYNFSYAFHRESR